MPDSISCSASSPIAPVRADTSHTRLNRRPDLPGSRTHTVPAALATSIAAARSITNSCSASAISTGSGATAGFCLCLRRAPTSLALPSNPSHYHRVDRPGASVKGTEILTGVLEATVRDPARSGPSAKLLYGLVHPDTIDVGRRPAPIFTPTRRPQKATGSCCEMLRGCPLLRPVLLRGPRSGRWSCRNR